MAVTVISSFTSYSKGGAGPWAAVMAAWPSSPNGDSGVVAITVNNQGPFLFSEPVDPGGVSDPLSSVVIDFDYAVTNSDANGQGEIQYPTTLLVGPGLSQTGHLSCEMIGSIPDVATLFGAVWAGWSWNSEYDGSFTAYNQRLIISNFTVTVTDAGVALESLTPSLGTKRGGTVVTLTGTGFTGATAVRFGATAATSLIVESDTTIICVTPAHVGGLVDVSVVGATTSTLANAFTFVAVDHVSPRTGTVAGGTPVTVTGFGFNAETGVLFGSVAATSVVLDSVTPNLKLTTVTPAHPSGLVDVTVLGVDSGADLYTYTLPVPQLQGKGPLLPPIPTRRA